MNRRNGMLMAIICILVVGVSVTKMTRQFVASEGADTAAVSSVMETRAASVQQAVPMEAAVPTASIKQLTEQTEGRAAQGAPFQEAAPETAVEEIYMEAAAEERSVDSGAGASGGQAGSTSGENSLAEAGAGRTAGDMAEKAEFDGASAEAAAGAVPGGGSSGGQTGGETSGAGGMAGDGGASSQAHSGSAGGETSVTGASDQADTGAPGGQAAQERYVLISGTSGNGGEASSAPGKAAASEETVKSPLDPAVETDSPATVQVELVEAETSYTSDDLHVRLAEAEEKAVIYREAAVEAKPSSAYTAAEQERILWDRELNIIYTSIRSSMSEKEAEELKVSELEWLKERDMAAEKAAFKNTVAKNQNVESVQVLAEKTKERCYELLSSYEDVLGRTAETGK